MRAHAGGRAQARGTPAGGCARGAGGWVAILTGAGRAVGVGAAAGVNALLAGPPERSRAGGANGAIGQGGLGQTRDEESETPVGEKELQFRSFEMSGSGLGNPGMLQMGFWEVSVVCMLQFKIRIEIARICRISI